ncbi:coiled-coil domain-containing protein 181-like [Ptychodera flava]|uniref:coiled-coil domain-containing protein 181-like n=1 Tax=Ptychodera flava TaxID=63121 RepID=UPI003969C037
MSAAVEQQPVMNGDIGPSSHGDTDSVDNELDWLIDKDKPQTTKETEEEEELPRDVIADGDFIPRNSTQNQGEENQGDDPYPRTSPRLESESGEEEDDYELTEEQREAELLLQKMREEGSLPSEDPPEYDVGERIKQLNEELAKEGEVEEKKDRKVGFKDFVEEVPPDDDEEEDKKDREAEAENEEKMKDLNINDDNEDVDGGRTQENGVESQQETEKPKEKDREDAILVERNGKFEMINVSDLTAEERAVHGLEPVPESPRNGASSGNSSDSSESIQPTPPSHPRPATATGSTGSRRKVLGANGNSQRASSAGTQRSPPNDGTAEDDGFSSQYSGYSRYGLTPEQREYKKEHSRLMAQRRKEQEEKEKEERERKREEAESAFQAWLEKKREDEKERRKLEKERRKQEEGYKEERDPQGAYKSWVKAKSQEKRKEKQTEKKQSQEELNGYYLRSREDCDKAFRDQGRYDSYGYTTTTTTTTTWTPTDHTEWKKKKNAQLSQQKSLSRAHNLRRKLEARRSRKSQNLAKAIRQAQTYKYTDYYGYRY